MSNAKSSSGSGHSEGVAGLKSASAAAATPDGADLYEQVRAIGEDVKELARLGKTALGHKVDAAKEATQHAVMYGRDKAVEYRDMVADKAKSEPIKALLIAAGVGGAIGLILGRR